MLTLWPTAEYLVLHMSLLEQVVRGSVRKILAPTKHVPGSPRESNTPVLTPHIVLGGRRGETQEEFYIRNFWWLCSVNTYQHASEQQTPPRRAWENIHICVRVMRLFLSGR